jgi:hypothetical protein
MELVVGVERDLFVHALDAVLELCGVELSCCRDHGPSLLVVVA